MIFSKPEDPYREDALGRDLMVLWNSGRFDDIRTERKAGQKTGSFITSWWIAASCAPSKP
jgi:hypothetical protein